MHRLCHQFTVLLVVLLLTACGGSRPALPAARSGPTATPSEMGATHDDGHNHLHHGDPLPFKDVAAATETRGGQPLAYREWVATEAGHWMLHCHIPHHTTNDGEEPGGMMLMIEVL